MRWFAAVVVCAALCVGAGCSKNDKVPASQDPQATSTVAPAKLTPISEDGLRKKLQQFGGLDDAYAGCMARALWPTLSDEQRRELNQPNPPDSLTGPLLDRAQTLSANCSSS